MMPRSDAGRASASTVVEDGRRAWKDPMSPRSTSIRTNSTEYSGFPDALTTIASVNSEGIASSPASASTSSRVSPSESGGSASVVAKSLSLHFGRRSKSSGRVVATIRIGSVPRPPDEVLDEVQQSVIGPLDVLEDEYERAPPRNRLEVVPPCGERRPPLIDARLLSVAEPDEGTQVAFDATRLCRDRHEVADGRVQLAGSGRRSVGLEHAGLGLNDLTEGPEGHALGVRRRASETRS